MYIKQKYGTVFCIHTKHVAGEDIMASFGQINFILKLHRHINKWLGGKNVGKIIYSGRNLSEGGNCKLYVKNGLHLGNLVV